MPCSPLLVQPASLYNPDPPTRSGTAHSQLGPANSTDLPTGQFDGGSCSAEASSSQATPACFKLTKNKLTNKPRAQPRQQP